MESPSHTFRRVVDKGDPLMIPQTSWCEAHMNAHDPNTHSFQQLLTPSNGEQITEIALPQIAKCLLIERPPLKTELQRSSGHGILPEQGGFFLVFLSPKKQGKP